MVDAQDKPQRDWTTPPDAKRVWDAVESASEFFMGKGPVYRTLFRLIDLLEKEKIPYAVAGGMALNIYGYKRQTTDVDLVMTKDGHARLKAAALGHGYLEKYSGSKGIRDTIDNVKIDFLITGDYPGDGKAKPVSFPDPSCSVPTVVPNGTRAVSVVPISKLVELKIASGISAPHRLKDLSDVIELVRAAKLSRELVDELDPSVRDRYVELWQHGQVFDPISEE